MSSLFEAFLPFTRAQVSEVHAATKEAQSSGTTILKLREKVYDEETFRGFLWREHRRAAMSERPYLLLLIGLHSDLRRGGGAMSDPLAADVFSSLEECVREVDVVGWYRQGRILGAILPQGEQVCMADAGTRISARIKQTLDQRLSPGIAKLLRVRIVRLGHRERL